MDGNTRRTTWPRTLLLAAGVAVALVLGAFAAPEFAAPERAEAQQNCNTIITVEPWFGSWARVERWVAPCDTSKVLTVDYLRDCNGAYIPDTESWRDKQDCAPSPTEPGAPCYSPWGQPAPCQPGDSNPGSPPSTGSTGGGGSGPTGGGGGPTGGGSVDPDDLFQDLPPDLRDLLLRFLDF